MSATWIDQDRLRNLVVPILLLIASAGFLYYLMTGKGDRYHLRNSMEGHYPKEEAADPK